MDLFLISFGALFSIMNPLGTVPVFVGLTQENTKRQRALTAFWTAFNVFIILLLSFFAGKYILSFFGISLNDFDVAEKVIFYKLYESLLNTSDYQLINKFIELNERKIEISL